MKDILKPNLVNERQRVRMSVNDIMHTRITGVHHVWPQDKDTTRRLNRLNEHPFVDAPRRLPNWVALVGFTLIIASAWGLVLLWLSL